MNPTSPKVLAGTAAAAFATLVWAVVAAVWPDLLTETELASLAGATITLFSAVAAYIVRDPLRSVPGQTVDVEVINPCAARSVR